tara:strand:- start:2255 stop:3397 length:1143 start_codon:yes stop_codon:yes gene_type:complete
MPLPEPRNKEKRSAFVSRCVAQLSEKGEFDDDKQRAAVCYDIFKDAEANASVVVGEGDNQALFFSASNDKNKPLNKPFRTPKGPKKFSVYVKNDKGNVVKVNFGDPNMEIKRDDPKRRKAFRSRHNCDNAGPKWKARYWSCKMWSKKSVTDVVKGSDEYEWDGETFFDQDELIKACPALADAPEVSESAKRSGPKSGAQTPAEPSERKKGSKKNPKGSAKKGGGKITFSEKTTNTLKEKVKSHNAKYSKKVSLTQLKRVYRRGAGAFSSSHRPNMSRHGWAMARVNMFLKMMRGGKVKDSYRKADQDIAKASKKKKAYSYGSPDVGDHYFETKEEAMKDAEKMGLKGIHTHKTEDGKTVYMAGPNHEAFMKRHKEIIKNK